MQLLFHIKKKLIVVNYPQSAFYLRRKLHSAQNKLKTNKKNTATNKTVKPQIYPL
jgi:hypothetical protein